MRTNIGIEGTTTIRWDGPALEPRTVAPTAKNAIDLRVGIPIARDGKSQIELHFIGTRAGRFDLRDYLQRKDGQPLTDMQPIPIEVQALLPANFVGDLESHPDPPLPQFLPYRTILVILGAVWAALGIRHVVRRFAARPRVVAVVSKTEPSLEEQISPLVAAAAEGKLSPADKARLEQLLLGIWRRRLELGDTSAEELLAKMRNHAEAGDLLKQLELWLHSRQRTEPADVDNLLASYRHHIARGQVAVRAKEAVA
ncbi:MAG: hypothetical protein K8T25_20255 [Planctomycetia bacterium]|nr:hypothetical protein [Planctomycetia bacterium]